MRRFQKVLAAGGILLACLGMTTCTTGPSCLCAISSAASKFAYAMLELDTIAACNISPFYAAADPAGKFLYDVDQNSGRIDGFSIDQTTGALTAVPGSPVTPQASEPRVPIVDPTGSFLYLTHLDSCGDDCTGAISAYKIGTDGSLTEISGSPYNTDYGTLGVAISPSGQFLYAMNGTNCCHTANSISVFQINSASGALTEVTGSPFSSPLGTPLFPAFQPNGNFLYVITASEGNFLATFSIAASGAPTFMSGASYSLGPSPQGIDVDSLDSFLYVADNGQSGPTGLADGSISAFRMNGMDGTLSAVTGSPFTTTGSNPFQLAVDRSCRFLYTTNNNPSRGTAGDYVLGFAIDPNAGTLTAVPGSPFSTPSGGPPQGIVLTPHRSTTGSTP
jgi:6-phosphogluconolactonase